MIVGVGVDLCRVEPIRRSIDRFGKDWLDEVFTDEEQIRLGPGEQLGKRAAIGFALKEACSKTIGTGFARGVRRQDFVVTIDRMGCSVRLTGAAKRRAIGLCGASALVQLQTHFRSTTGWITALAILQSASSCTSFSSLDLLPLLPD
ncbi:MAG: 4'-phosphopantetheinyl transferase superfamily protein [Methylobacterium radiotolerans]